MLQHRYPANNVNVTSLNDDWRITWIFIEWTFINDIYLSFIWFLHIFINGSFYGDLDWFLHLFFRRSMIWGMGLTVGLITVSGLGLRRQSWVRDGKQFSQRLPKWHEAKWRLKLLLFALFKTLLLMLSSLLQLYMTGTEWRTEWLTTSFIIRPTTFLVQ